MERKIFVLPLLISIFIAFLIYQTFQELYTFFTLYTQGAIWLTLGMVGTSDGVKKGWVNRKKKFGSSGFSSKGLESFRTTAYREHGRQRGKANIGNKHSAESIANRVRSYLKTVQRKRKENGGIFKISPKKGLSHEEFFGAERALEISEKMSCNNGNKKKSLVKIRKLYGFAEDIFFVPASFKEHLFAREVLVEKTKYYAYIEFNGLQEHPALYDRESEKWKVIVPAKQ